MAEEIPELCMSVLRKIFGSDLAKYSISVQGRGTMGEGYLNEMIFLDLISHDRDIHLLCKMMPAVKTEELKKVLEPLYDTEIAFYETVWPVLDKFQRDTSKGKFFDKIAKYFGSLCENGRRVLVLENLKFSDFVLRGKKHMYDKNLVELLFKDFGNFHALSMALKEHNRKEFDRLSNLLTETWSTFMEWRLVKDGIVTLCKLATTQLTDDDEELKYRMHFFAERVLDEFEEVILYKGNNPVIIHGDCWINNFMFKLNESGKLADLRHIDFQLAQLGTPVYDLSYCFYSGATKDLLEDLEYYLHIYHSNLSSKLRELGCDPEKLYPYEVLKKEWKQYSKLGFMMSIMVWRGQTSDTAETGADEIMSLLDHTNCDEAKYAELTGDLIRHMYQNGFL